MCWDASKEQIFGKMMSVKIILTLVLLIGMQLSLEADSSTWMDVSFRINKLNFIWSKAIHHLSDKSVIKRLKNELDKFDLLYSSAKATSTKNEKLILEEVDNKLIQLLEKYGLESTVNAYMKKYKWRNEEEIKEENRVLSLEKFDDPKLQKLWHAAQNSDFSKTALKSKISCVCMCVCVCVCVSVCVCYVRVSLCVYACMYVHHPSSIILKDICQSNEVRNFSWFVVD
ncbi:unnamed protein product [Onchocerca flexuosa]|uniref:Alpha-2-MRAP_N domain-containing protein n=1 Tax=Onchocerca flexuosa TaxID=387005 RepID=A0A183H579_9BILA|nr:unnamed protein product [Onchocerca flexuosa]